MNADDETSRSCAISIRVAESGDADWINCFLSERWTASIVAVHGEAIEAARLPALIAGDYQGLATYRLLGEDAELVTLDARPQGTGTGTALVDALAIRVRAHGCRRLWVTTTNANLSALRFYQSRGFRLIQVRAGAVDAARKLKPAIPLVGNDGTPLRDELDLCRTLYAWEAVPPSTPWTRRSEDAP
jgi:GNAT superfamily N-acetyltransferase